MKQLSISLLGLLPLSAALLIAQTSGTATASHHSAAVSTQQTAKMSTGSGDQNPGERKFRANCGRCHNAPEELSPRITGTVLRHMRVRASLSAEDERDILRYLAP
jgi:cytochrome c5